MRWVTLAAFCYSLLMSLVSLDRAEQLGGGVFDLGIHDQATWLVYQGLNPFLTTRGLQVQADHFSPIAYLLAPIYLLWDDPRALLVLQSCWLGAGAFPVYLLARGRVVHPGLAVGLAILYLCQSCLMFANLFDFHYSTLLFTPFLWLCYALEAKDLRIYYASLITAWLCSETACVSFLALVPLAWKYLNWRQALATALLAGSCSWLSMSWVGWHNQGQPTQYGLLYAEHKENSPWQSLQRLNNERNQEYLLQLYVPLLFAPWLSPLEMLPAAPVLAGNLLSWRESQQSIRYHYCAGILPFLMWATCRAWGRLERRSSPRVAAWLLAIACFVGLGVGPLFPEEWRPHENHRRQALTSIQQLLPEEASVSVENNVGALLCHRRQAYLFPNPIQPAAWGSRPQALIDQSVMGFHPYGPGQVRRSLEQISLDYFVIEPGGGSDFPLTRPDRHYFFQEILAFPGFGVVLQEGGIILLGRERPGRFLPKILPQPNWRDWWQHLKKFQPRGASAKGKSLPLVN